MSRNVALVVLDTVRKDYFDLYAPRLRARSDTSFEQCRAASSWSVPSHTSMFTGDLPSVHGANAEHFDADFDFGEHVRDRTFLSTLPARTTIGLSANAYMNTTFGFDALFDEFDDFSIGSHTAESLFPSGLTVHDYEPNGDPPLPLRYLSYVRAALAHERPGRSLANVAWTKVGRHYKRLPLPEVVDDGASAISRAAVERTSAAEEPFFLFANFMDAHTPLRPLYQYDNSLYSVPRDWSSTHVDKWELNLDGLGDETYARRYRALYGAAIDYLDRQVDEMIDAIQRATDRETTFVIVSDHGHELGYPSDGGRFHHTGSLSEALLHTPCEVVNAPDGSPDTVERRVSQLDLGALLRRVARGEAIDESTFADRVAAELVGLLGVEDGTWGREFSDAEFAHWNRMIRCLYHRDVKIQWDSLGTSTVYATDPRRPSWQGRIGDCDVPDWARRQFETDIQTYKRSADSADQDLEFDDAVADRLETLGYL